MSAMRISEGVEWAAHACVAMSMLPEGAGVTAAALAALHDLPPAYMAKHMQSLARAGVVTASRGPSGGYRLARPAAAISLFDIVTAVDGAGPAFRCQEIRQRGRFAAKCRPTAPCGIAAAFWQAEASFAASLRQVSIAALAEGVVLDMATRAAVAAWTGADPPGEPAAGD